MREQYNLNWKPKRQLENYLSQYIRVCMKEANTTSKASYNFCASVRLYLYVTEYPHPTLPARCVVQVLRDQRFRCSFVHLVHLFPWSCGLPNELPGLWLEKEELKRSRHLGSFSSVTVWHSLTVWPRRENSLNDIPPSKNIYLYHKIIG